MKKEVKEQCKECIFCYRELGRQGEKGDLRCMKTSMGWSNYELLRKCGFFMSEEDYEQLKKDTAVERMFNKTNLDNQSLDTKRLTLVIELLEMDLKERKTKKGKKSK